jgi:RimJ/RimL family protein N-acetyltransferase
MRRYKCLSNQIFESGEYKLVPIRDEDKYEIMNWRNEQIDILRQKEPLTQEKQEWYFENVVAKLFEEEKPSQLLFSFLKKDELVGYGGLVHIDWESANGEISFLTSKSRADNQDTFFNDWTQYLGLLKKISQNELMFHKIFTYAYSVRQNLFPILEKNGFKKEATLKDHISINKNFYDVIIHTYYFPKLIGAELIDSKDIFDWRNDEMSRKNSFNSSEINFEEHNNW